MLKTKVVHEGHKDNSCHNKEIDYWNQTEHNEEKKDVEQELELGLRSKADNITSKVEQKSGLMSIDLR